MLNLSIDVDWEYAFQFLFHLQIKKLNFVVHIDNNIKGFCTFDATSYLKE